MKLLRRLGFWIDYAKVAGLCKKITFLGINLDSTAMTISLPQEKIDDLTRDLNKLSTSKKSKQTLAPKYMR